MMTKEKEKEEKSPYTKKKDVNGSSFSPLTCDCCNEWKKWLLLLLTHFISPVYAREPAWRFRLAEYKKKVFGKKSPIPQMRTHLR